ncbi:MAG: AAA family ATPase [Actinobacteria bacterium]|nr:AAA family ATPase [Actinomycetota bacterium]
MSVYLVAGPPAVGKSTVARLLAASRSRSVLIDVDHIRDGMVVNGAVLPSEAEWSADLVEQLVAARGSACAIANAYAAIGFDVVIDDFYDPQSRLSEYDGLAGLDPRRVLLLPDRDVAVSRSNDRSPEAAEFIAAGIAEVYELMPTEAELATAGWLVMDTSRETPQQTCDRILDR